jgi:predicted transcriptional regulator
MIHSNLLPLAIKESSIVSKGQKEILLNILQFEDGLAMSDLVNIMKQSKQTLFLKVKKLLDRDFLIREKDMVYMYKVNSKKMIEILEHYLLVQEKKNNIYFNTKKNVDSFVFPLYTPV